MRLPLVVVMLALTAGYVVLHPPADLAVGHGALAACPATFGGWNGTDLSFEDAVLDELKADDVLVRRYVLGDEVAWLTIVYHHNRRYGAHDPRVCYESQGYLVQPAGLRRVADGSPEGLQVNLFRAARGHERRLVYYWWTTSGLATADAGAWRERMALAGALDNRSWGAFVRIEVLVGRAGEARSLAALGDFAARVARTLPGVFAAAQEKAAR
jgi:EpsI family protein